LFRSTRHVNVAAPSSERHSPRAGWVSTNEHLDVI